LKEKSVIKYLFLDIGGVLVADVIDRVPGLGSRAAYVKQFLRDKLLDHKKYIKKYGQDMPEIRNWKWSNHNNNRRKI